MDRTPVKSSNLVSVGYDQQQQILEIEFNTGSIYQYLNVPADLYNGLMSADSQGRYFDAQIRNAGYVYRQIK